MPIPGFQELLLPVLRLAGDGKEHTLKEAVETLASEFRLTPEEREELLPSGTIRRFDDRVGWARTYLKKAGLLETPRRGAFRITPEGLRLLQENPQRLTAKDLERYESFIEFKSLRHPRPESSGAASSPAVQAGESEEMTAEERMDAAYEEFRNELEDDILERIQEAPPRFFERLVVKLLQEMGYGGSREEAATVTKQSRDGGIDSIIKEDPLGLDSVYIQAKRWKGTVGSSVVREFVGALHQKKARKGVLITTGSYSADAQDVAKDVDVRVVLIDGKTLARYLVDYGVGVSTMKTYEIKKIDTDYFSEE